MSTRSPHLRRFVRHALTATTGDATPETERLAAAFDLLSQRLHTRLHPVFGSAALAALFARARHLAKAEFPWLADVVPASGGCSREGVERARREHGAAVVVEGLAAVLAFDLALLSTFIGEDLVMPLVQEAWGTASLDDRPNEDA